MQSGGNPPQIRLSSNQNMSESQYSCIFVNRGKYDWFFLFFSFFLFFFLSLLPPVQVKPQIITVSVFQSTLQLTVAANHFTFDKFPLPHPLLHPNACFQAV